ncbi:MAG: hypothetical protein WBX15_13190 [Thermoanaerobaculia bacterium]
MRAVAVLMLGALMGTAIPAVAAESAETPAVSSRTTSPPDYSREALLRILAEARQRAEAEQQPFSGIVVYQKHGMRLRWLPLMLPLSLLYGTLGDAGVTVNPMVDPFALTNTVFPSTADNSHDRWREWRFRSMLRRNVEAANRGDNETGRSQ